MGKQERQMTNGRTGERGQHDQLYSFPYPHSDDSSRATRRDRMRILPQGKERGNRVAKLGARHAEFRCARWAGTKTASLGWLRIALNPRHSLPAWVAKCGRRCMRHKCPCVGRLFHAKRIRVRHNQGGLVEKQSASMRMDHPHPVPIFGLFFHTRLFFPLVGIDFLEIELFLFSLPRRMKRAAAVSAGLNTESDFRQCITASFSPPDTFRGCAISSTKKRMKAMLFHARRSTPLLPTLLLHFFILLVTLSDGVQGNSVYKREVANYEATLNRLLAHPNGVTYPHPLPLGKEPDTREPWIGRYRHYWQQDGPHLREAVSHCRATACPNVAKVRPRGTYVTSPHYRWKDQHGKVQQSAFVRAVLMDSDTKVIMPPREHADVNFPHNWRVQLAPGRTYRTMAGKIYKGPPEGHPLRTSPPNHERGEPRRIEHEVLLAKSKLLPSIRRGPRHNGWSSLQNHGVADGAELSNGLAGARSASVASKPGDVRPSTWTSAEDLLHADSKADTAPSRKTHYKTAVYLPTGEWRELSKEQLLNMRPRTLPGEPKHQLFVPVSHEEVLRNLPRYDVQRQPQVHPDHLKNSTPTSHGAAVLQTYDIDRQQGTLMRMPEDGARNSSMGKGGGASLSRRGLAGANCVPAKVEQPLEVLDATVHRAPRSPALSHDAAEERASTSASSRARRPNEITPFVKHDTKRPLLYKHALDQAVDYACKSGKCPGAHHFGSLDAFATSKQYHWNDETGGTKKSGFFRVKAIGTKGRRLMPSEKDADPVHKHNFRLQLAPGQKFQYGNEKFEGAPEDHEMRHRLPSNDWSELHLVGRRPDRSMPKQPRRVETESAQAFSEQELLRKISKHMHAWNREARDRDAIELTPGIEGTVKGPARFYEYQNHKLRRGKPMPTISLTPHVTDLSAEDLAAAMRARAAKKARKDAAQRAEQQGTSITTHESLDTAEKPLNQRLLRAANAPAYHPLRALYGSDLEHAGQGFRRLSLSAPQEPHSPKFNPVPYSPIANAPPNAKTNKRTEFASPATLAKRVFHGGICTSSECLLERTLKPARKLVFAKEGPIAPSYNLMRKTVLPPRTTWKHRLQRRGTPMTTIEWSKSTKYEPLTQSTIQKSVNYCQKHVCRDLKRFKVRLRRLLCVSAARRSTVDGSAFLHLA
ncbi:hypothetical protein IE81DRAFT_204347 [Ceraceosorus guamensis]|uniref:Uncharacterized protein n=1 Tax=Ceraceosorus guamensis TaxID=1522189 RepID=A0A316VWT6_9BASI|nr:hypothetical protein IE81DRAFT_204347 [Ceraceosorus guamensis]PWN40741.1 hypothetical protein IE81DRAFT_204347 [Ceraceosorus guamensis]